MISLFFYELNNKKMYAFFNIALKSTFEFKLPELDNFIYVSSLFALVGLGCRNYIKAWGGGRSALPL